MNTAVILSGGRGTRIHGADRPKQYLEVCGREIIEYVLETTARAESIDTWVIVSDSSWTEHVRTVTKKVLSLGENASRHIEVFFAEPGEVRQLSIMNGLKKLVEEAGEDISDDDLVAVIDAARPNMSLENLEACMRAAGDCDGIMPVLPMKDTVYLTDGKDRIKGLLDRSEVFAGQAPEVFRFRKYLAANEALSRDEMLLIHGSSEPAVKAGMDMRVIPGDEHNYKITTDDDLKRFRQECEEKKYNGDNI